MIESSFLPCLLFAEFLSLFDLIIINYNVFGSEYRNVTAAKPAFRRPPRHPLCRSSLFSLRYWRVVLDEVHLVETSSTLMEEVALFDSEYSWCVSGTPFNKKFDEMFRVMKLLRIYHYGLSYVWRECVEVRVSLLLLSLDSVK